MGAGEATPVAEDVVAASVEFKATGKNDKFSVFAYNDTIEEACSETTLSFWSIVSVVCILALLLCVAITAICTSVKYKNKYTHVVKARGERKGLTTVHGNA